VKTEELAIPGVLLLTSEIHRDDRGWFMEILREDALSDRFVQSNHSHSGRGVLRGLHYHARQADAWYVVNGTARVGLADLREKADRPATLTLELSADERRVLYIPPGVAHGFYAVTEIDVVYWVTQEFDNSDEHSVRWDDPSLEVPWDAAQPILSDRDRGAPALDWDQVAANLEARP
jgi:dTDP-4-dehydrorhamnose 3,5-epimerase